MACVASHRDMGPIDSPKRHKEYTINCEIKGHATMSCKRSRLKFNLNNKATKRKITEQPGWDWMCWRAKQTGGDW